MNTLVLPYTFDDDIDVYRVKNAIENATNISVSIVSENLNSHKFYRIYVEKSNYNKSLIILNREISIIEYFKEKEATKELTEYYESVSFNDSVISTENYIVNFFLSKIEFLVNLLSFRRSANFS